MAGHGTARRQRGTWATPHRARGQARPEATGRQRGPRSPAGSAAGMSQVPRKLPEEEEDGDEEEEEEEEIVGLAGYADGAESFSDGDAESGGDEACEWGHRHRGAAGERRGGRRGAAGWGVGLLPEGRGPGAPVSEGGCGAAAGGG